jgi:SAM-dependent methyltransferase
MDKTNYTPVEPIYFWQDVWFATHLFKYRPAVHYDIGSSYKTISIIAQFTKIIFVDIRPPIIIAPNVDFVKGDILNLPFENESIDSLSSLCVVEHIGLGRYGDTIDPYGSEKAINELKRVLRKGDYFT